MLVEHHHPIWITKRTNIAANIVGQVKCCLNYVEAFPGALRSFYNDFDGKVLFFPTYTVKTVYSIHSQRKGYIYVVFR